MNDFLQQIAPYPFNVLSSDALVFIAFMLIGTIGILVALYVEIHKGDKK